MAKFFREKAVFITVYEEDPRRRRVSPSQHHHHHHHHHHLHHHHHHHHHHHYLHHIGNQYNSGDSDKGYNRRAELLRYSHSLRDSAQPAAASTSLLPKPIPPNNNQQSSAETATVHRKQSKEGTPACLGNWKILIQSFTRCFSSPKGKKDRKKSKQSGSTTNKMKALRESFQVRKNRGFIPKPLSTSRKHR